MRFRPAVTVFIILAASAQQHASAQCSSPGPIAVERVPLGGGTPIPVNSFESDCDFSVDVTGLSGDWVIHIYDSTFVTAPNENAGHVTITGQSSNLASLAVFVSAPAEIWTDTNTTPIEPGLVDFGGLTISDSGTRAKTRATIAVTGDITHTTTAQIHVNQIVRVQAEGVTSGGVTSGGVIDADIIADGGTLFSGEDAIGQVRAWNAIRGKVEAVDQNIFAVRVIGDPAGSPAPEGIRGDILAESGSIDTIYTTGPIGTSLAPIDIYAGDGIFEIRAVRESSAGWHRDH